MSDMKEIKTIAGAVKSLGKFINETAMLSVKGSGRPVANQYVLNYERGQVFKSYRTLIAVRTNKGQIFLVRPENTIGGWDLELGGRNGGYSSTTQKYCCMFLGIRGKADMLKKMESGEYQVVE